MRARGWMGRGAALVIGTVALWHAGCASAARTAGSEPARSAPDEQVPVGYGTMARRQMAFSVGSMAVTREEAARTTNLAELLSGRIPGLQVLRTAGGYSLRVRGGGEALIVIDGMLPPEGIPNGMIISMVNPSDVARVDVLKDGAAGAIYGSRGGNGVILITTRRGAKN